MLQPRSALMFEFTMFTEGNQFGVLPVNSVDRGHYRWRDQWKAFEDSPNYRSPPPIRPPNLMNMEGGTEKRWAIKDWEDSWADYEAEFPGAKAAFLGNNNEMAADSTISKNNDLRPAIIRGVVAAGITAGLASGVSSAVAANSATGAETANAAGTLNTAATTTEAANTANATTTALQTAGNVTTGALPGVTTIAPQAGLTATQVAQGVGITAVGTGVAANAASTAANVTPMEEIVVQSPQPGPAITTPEVAGGTAGGVGVGPPEPATPNPPHPNPNDPNYDPDDYEPPIPEPLDPPLPGDPVGPPDISNTPPPGAVPPVGDGTVPPGTVPPTTNTDVLDGIDMDTIPDPIGDGGGNWWDVFANEDGTGVAPWAQGILSLGGAAWSLDAADRAAEAQRYGVDQALDYQRETRDLAIAENAPFLDTGRGATAAMQDMTNLERAEGLEGYAAYDWQTDPGYEFRLGEGQKGIAAMANAKGRNFTGGTARELTRYNSDFASAEFGKIYDRLGVLGGYGPNASGQNAQTYANSGNIMSQLAQSRGQYAGQGQLNRGNIGNSFFNDISQLQWGKA